MGVGLVPQTCLSVFLTLLCKEMGPVHTTNILNRTGKDFVMVSSKLWPITGQYPPHLGHEISLVRAIYVHSAIQQRPSMIALGIGDIIVQNWQKNICATLLDK